MSTYNPTTPPHDPKALPQWLAREFVALKQALERAYPNLIWEYLSAEPARIKAGMEVLADGTNWDPGSIGVAAKYRRSEDNTSWELIEAIGVAAGLAAHLADTADAHDASAISIADAGNDFTATDVEGALAELKSDHEADAQALADHEAAADPHPGYLTPAEGNAAYQPLDGDLTSWSGVSRAAGFDAWVATPSSVNFKTLITDETGSGALVFADTPTLIAPLLGTPTSGNLANCTFPTLNQNTTGSAAKWTTARNLAGNSVDGSANVAFANKFVVQGTTDAGLSAAQFLGALGTGIVKNTTTTGVLSIAVAGDFPTLNQDTTGNAATVTIANEASDTTCFPLFATAASGSLAPKTNANMTFNASTGVITLASSILTTADINGGTVDGATVGASSAAAGTFTTLTATGQLVISGAGAGQIVFPAAQNASANANTLDDYEEGSWTPAVTFGGGATGVTYGAQTGTYTKIGNRVFFSGVMTLTNKGSSAGNAIIAGLPFTVNETVAVSIRITAITSGVGDTFLSGIAQATSTGIRLDKITTGNVVQLANTDFTNTTSVYMAGHYPVA